MNGEAQRGEFATSQVLARAARAGRLHHGIVLCGKPGVGKLALARRLAQIVNCLEDAEARPCGACRSCRRIARDLHPDVLRLEPEGAAYKVEQIRGLLPQAESRPFEGKKRVFILEDAGRLTLHCANALLKSLEEPRSGATFILLAATADSLLPTVRSRCLEFTLPPPSREEAHTRLCERPDLPADLRDWLAGWAAFSPAMLEDSDPRRLWDRTEELVCALETLATPTERPPTGAILELAARLKEEESLDEQAPRLLVFMRDVLLARLGAPSESLTNAPWAERLRLLAPSFSPAALRQVMSRLLELPGLRPLNLSRQLQFEWIFWPLVE